MSGEAASGLEPTDFAVIGSKAVFTGYDSSGYDGLWVTDGTAAGTTEIAPSSLTNGYSISNVFSFGSKALFDTGANDYLWVTDGTAAGTTLLTTGEAITPFAALDGKALFIKDGTTYGAATTLWSTDGTVAGTTQIASSDARPGQQWRLADQRLCLRQ